MCVECVDSLMKMRRKVLDFNFIAPHGSSPAASEI